MTIFRVLFALGLFAGVFLEPSPTNSAPAAETVVLDGACQTEFRERHFRIARPVWETSERETRRKIMRPVWETQWREETYTVRKPVIETAMREEQYTLYEPVTVSQPQTIDQGQWVQQQLLHPRKPATRLRWIPGGWTADAQTGRNYWKPPMLRPVQVERPPRVEALRVWQPNLIETQIPTTTYAPRVHVRQAPIQQVRYVEERRVRKVPQRVCRMVEQEIVERVPVTVCRTVYEEKVERVPVPVSRRPAACCLPGPCDESQPMQVPLPSPMPPISRPELDPRSPVPAPVFPQDSPGQEDRSSESSRTEAIDPAAVALFGGPGF